jgi:hypothetical protein
MEIEIRLIVNLVVFTGLSILAFFFLYQTRKKNRRAFYLTSDLISGVLATFFRALAVLFRTDEVKFLIIDNLVITFLVLLYWLFYLHFESLNDVKPNLIRFGFFSGIFMVYFAFLIVFLIDITNQLVLFGILSVIQVKYCFV